jgi:hypothetical protein
VKFLDPRRALQRKVAEIKVACDDCRQTMILRTAIFGAMALCTVSVAVPDEVLRM